MKKLAVLSGMAFASAMVCAQSSSSSVQMYGSVDAGLTRVSGLAKGTDNSLSSGIMDGSRWGLRGNEDMGGGWRGIFTLESRFESNNGTLSNRPASGTQVPDRLSNATLLGLPAVFQPAVSAVAASVGSTAGVNLPSRFFDRQLYVGLVTPGGAVTAGRQYTPAYELAANFDILGTQSALSPGQIASLPAGIDIRVSNSIAYRIVSGPVTASLMASTSDDLTQPHLRAGMAMYKTDMFAVGLGYNTRKNELNQKSLTSTVLGASFETGPHKVSVEAVAFKDDHPTGLSGIAANLIAGGAGAAVGAAVQDAFTSGLKQDARLYHVGYRYLTGPNTVYLALNKVHDRLREADTTSYGVAYSYALSKRTDLNLVLVHYNNKDLAQAAPGGQGYLGGVTASAGKDSNSYALGLRHRF